MSIAGGQWRMAPRRWAGLKFAARAVAILAAVGLSVVASDPDIDAALGHTEEFVLWTWVALLFLDWGWSARLAARSGAGALSYLASANGIIDLVSAIAVPLAWLAGAREAGLWLFGAIWLLKLIPASPKLTRLARVLQREAGSLAAVGVIFTILLFGSAAALYGLEGADQAEAFGTIPRALWWAINTVTGVGIEAVPETVVGRVVAGALMVVGLGVFGLFAGILASGFSAEVRREEFLGAWELVSRVSFLKALGPAAIADLAGSLRRMSVPENTVIVRRGQRGECMYFVAEGEVEVQLPNGTVALGEGSFFGELALLEGGNGLRSATVRCTRPALLLVLDVADFRALLARYPALASTVEEEAARRRVA